MAARRPRDERGDATPEHLKCAVCMSAPEGRAEQCKNGHLICAGEGDCLFRLRQSSGARREQTRCPTCREPLPDSLARCLVAEQSIACLPARCRHCSANLKRGDLGAHEASCPRREMPCAGEGCAWRGLEKDKAEHEKGCTRAIVHAATEPLRLAFGETVGRMKVETARLKSEMERAHVELARSKVDLTQIKREAQSARAELTRSKERELHLAAGMGNQDHVLHLLEEGVDVNALCRNSWTALLEAVRLEKLVMVRLLLSKGASVNFGTELPTGHYGHSYAVYLASITGNVEILKLLLEKGAEMNRTGCVGLPPLIAAILKKFPEVVKVLVANGANVSVKARLRNKNGEHEDYTALKLARRMRCPEIVSALERAGAL